MGTLGEHDAHAHAHTPNTSPKDNESREAKGGRKSCRGLDCTSFHPSIDQLEGVPTRGAVCHLTQRNGLIYSPQEIGLCRVRGIHISGTAPVLSSPCHTCDTRPVTSGPMLANGRRGGVELTQDPDPMAEARNPIREALTLVHEDARRPPRPINLVVHPPWQRPF